LGAAWFISALILALSAGALTGVLAAYYLNNSRYSVEVSALATYRPPQVTTIYADDGETVLAEFAIEKRIPVKEQDIPKTVENALLAVEDYRFYNHIGIDPYRIAGRGIQEHHDRQQRRCVDDHTATCPQPVSIQGSDPYA
jgi:penicillin-binding protein 1A